MLSSFLVLFQKKKKSIIHGDYKKSSAYKIQCNLLQSNLQELLFFQYILVNQGFFNTSLKILLHVIIHAVISSSKSFPIKLTRIDKKDCWYLYMRINTEAKQHGNGRSLNIKFKHAYLYWVSLHSAAKIGWSPI